VKVGLGLMDDPYDNFGFQQQVFSNAGLNAKYFILIGDFDTHDRNNYHRSLRFRRLLRTLEQSGDIGLHPSYSSFNNVVKIKTEKERLENIIGREVISSRQHYLRVKFPDTYRLLSQLGIKNDYSMGYSDAIGYRAGIAASYPFFDLLKNEETDLRIHPFGFMDTALADHIKISPRQSLERIEGFIDALAEIGGDLTGIWHNYALAGSYGYDGWMDFFTGVVEYTTKKDYDRIS